MASAYGFQRFDAQKMARARLVNQGISTKDSVEIAKAVRGRSLEKSIELMEKVVAMQQPIRYTRFNAESAGHKPGIGSGRYPVKSAAVFLQLLELARANAGQKDMDTDSLRIIHIKADKASTPFHYGRQRGRKMKRTHLEIVVMEDDAIKAKAKKKTAKKTSAKTEVKKTEAKKTESKKAEAAKEKPAEEKVKAAEEKPKAEEIKGEEKPQERKAEVKATEEKKDTETPMAAEEKKTDAAEEKNEVKAAEEKEEVAKEKPAEEKKQKDEENNYAKADDENQKKSLNSQSKGEKKE